MEMGGDSNDRRPPSPSPSVQQPVLNRQGMEMGGDINDLPPSPSPVPCQEMETGGVSDDQPPPPPGPPPPLLNDKSSEANQRLSWRILCGDINFQVNRVANIENRAGEELKKQAGNIIYSQAIEDISSHLLYLNLVRGRGILCSSLIEQQARCPECTDVYAALAARVNCEFPEVGNLLVRRLILEMKRAYTKDEKTSLLVATKFIAHLVNQGVVLEPNVLLILDNDTPDNVEVAVMYVMECGKMLQDVFPITLDYAIHYFRGYMDTLDLSKNKILGQLIMRLLSLYENKFEGFCSIRPGLCLMGPQTTHSIGAQEIIDTEPDIDVFKLSNSFLEDEEAFKERSWIQDRVT